MGGCASKDKNDKVVVSADGGGEATTNAGVTGEGDAAGNVNETKESLTLLNSTGAEANGEATKLNAEEGCVLVVIASALKKKKVLSV